VTFEAGETSIRTGDERRKTFERLVYPRLGKRPIHEITRSDINNLLDKIEDGSGTPMANHTLAYLRWVFNWHAARVDRFHPSIVRGIVLLEHDGAAPVRVAPGAPPCSVEYHPATEGHAIDRIWITEAAIVRVGPCGPESSARPLGRRRPAARD
jgi:hypothetical protein